MNRITTRSVWPNPAGKWFSRIEWQSELPGPGHITLGPFDTDLEARRAMGLEEARLFPPTKPSWFKILWSLIWNEGDLLA
jgi:hypothetical protein